MARIAWVCLSDLHLGALNSVLSAVADDGTHVEQSSVSPVLEPLGDALRMLRGDDEPPQLVVLGDLFELALSSTDDAAATFARFVDALAPGTSRAAVAPAVRFVPGNHDHHLWTRARDDHYLEYIGRAGADQALASEAHATNLVPAHDRTPVRDRMVELLAARAAAGSTLTVEQSYPNLGLVDDTGGRVLVLSHGHFIEPLYRAMSLLDDVFADRPRRQLAAHHLEAENGGWIDFFWSSMGDSGDIAAFSRQLYESLQSEQAIEAEIEAIRRAVVGRSGSRLRNHVEGLLAEGALGEGIKRMLRRERHAPEVLSDNAAAGLIDYLAGPVATQVAAEIGAPGSVGFVFGHTHKPFTDLRRVEGLPDPVPVVNTGGWVVDTPGAEPNKGASMVLVDEDLNVVSLRCYTQGTDPDHDVQLSAPPTEGENPLLSELAGRVDPRRDPWRALAEAATAVERDRRRQLEARLASETALLDGDRGRHRRARHPSTPPPG